MLGEFGKRHIILKVLKSHIRMRVKRLGFFVNNLMVLGL